MSFSEPRHRVANCPCRVDADVGLLKVYFVELLSPHVCVGVRTGHDDRWHATRQAALEFGIGDLDLAGIPDPASLEDK